MATVGEVHVAVVGSLQAVALEPVKAQIGIPTEDVGTGKEPAVVALEPAEEEKTADTASGVSDVEDIPIEKLSLASAAEEALPLDNETETTTLASKPEGIASPGEACPVPESEAVPSKETPLASESETVLLPRASETETFISEEAPRASDSDTPSQTEPSPASEPENVSSPTVTPPE